MMASGRSQPTRTLSATEHLIGADIGRLRRMSNLGLTAAGLTRDIDGACAELAFALERNRPWIPYVYNGSPHLIGGDVDGYEVRHTRLDGGHLPMHDTDHDDRWYFLVTGIPPTLTIRGGIRGAFGKRPEFWQDRDGDLRLQSPCYMIPQDCLTWLLTEPPPRLTVRRAAPSRPTF